MSRPIANAFAGTTALIAGPGAAERIELQSTIRHEGAATSLHTVLLSREDFTETALDQIAGGLHLIEFETAHLNGARGHMACPHPILTNSGPNEHWGRQDNGTGPIRIVKDSDKGLIGTVWRKNISRAQRFAERIGTGKTFVNVWNTMSVETP